MLLGRTVQQPPESQRIVRRGVLLIEAGSVSGIVPHVPSEFSGQILDLAGRFVVPALAALPTIPGAATIPFALPIRLRTRNAVSGFANRVHDEALYIGVAPVGPFLLDNL